MDSLFAYFNETYYDYNNGWNTHIPTFWDELMVITHADALEMCEGDFQCTFDYAVTNDISFAAATHMVTMSNQETQEILSEFSNH